MLDGVTADELQIQLTRRAGETNPISAEDLTIKACREPIGMNLRNNFSLAVNYR